MTKSSSNFPVDLKLSELKKVAAGMGTKGTPMARKGDLIVAISGGINVPVRSEYPTHTSRLGKMADTEPQLPVEVPERPAPELSEAERTDPGSLAQQSQPWVEDEGPNCNRRHREHNKERDHATQEATNEEVEERLVAALGQTDVPNTVPVLAPASAGAGRFEEDNEGGRCGRRRRNRDHQNRRNRSSGGMDCLENEPTVSEDDVPTAVPGIVDVLDNYAFVRTTGYLPGPNGAYLPLTMVRHFGLWRGNVIIGVIRIPREGGRKEKYNPLVRIDSVNEDDPEKTKQCPELAKLTPLYPQEELRLETASMQLTGRVIDLVVPIGKGQRGLIVSPPKAGKTMAMQAIANAIAANNPEVHLMVALVDERPEEVTDSQRTASGEVIVSTFDRPAEDHIVVTELAIERAKRLVELSHDMVALLDGITRLGRVYNLAVLTLGRILSDGVNSTALYPPKKFFGAVRDIENGGSLIILATALTETGSRMDEVIFEEFKDMGNMELRLARQPADKRIFPAIDVDASGTRREDLLLGRDELNTIWKLRRALSGFDDQAVLKTLLVRIRKTQNGHEFLLNVPKTTPAQDG